VRARNPALSFAACRYAVGPGRGAFTGRSGPSCPDGPRL